MLRSTSSSALHYYKTLQFTSCVFFLLPLLKLFRTLLSYYAFALTIDLRFALSIAISFTGIYFRSIATSSTEAMFTYIANGANLSYS